MTTLMALLAAVAATPSCPVPVGTPIAITPALLPVTSMGGSYVPGNGWPAPGEARVGLVRYDWGLLLRSNNPLFADFDLAPGPIHSRSSGCWFHWDYIWRRNNAEPITAPRISNSGYNDGYTPEQPTNPPAIAGYRFVMADKAYSPDYAWVGLWNAVDGSTRSQVVAFNDQRRKALATLPFRLGGLATLPSPDTPFLGITIIGEGKGGEAVPYIHLGWASGMAETSARSEKRQ